MEIIQIRKAEAKDLERIDDLLEQVLSVHHKGRPDLFKSVGRKYTDKELTEILHDGQKPVLVAVDETDCVVGYVFCLLQQHLDSAILTDIKTLYIDDLCVDESLRGEHVGRKLYQAAEELAKGQGCYNITLNVWSCNPQAAKFYETCGFKPQKIGMEILL